MPHDPTLIIALRKKRLDRMSRDDEDEEAKEEETTDSMKRGDPHPDLLSRVDNLEDRLSALEARLGKDDSIVDKEEGNPSHLKE